jgi:GAF domain-containing protein
MEHSEQALESARELTRLLLGDEDREATLRRIADLSCRVAPKSAMAGISLRQRGKWSTTVCTDATVAEVDKSQYQADSGPCVDAARMGEVTRIDSTDNEERWPEFAQAASAAGLKATISFPLNVDGETIGALNLYSRERAAFTDVDAAAGLLFAEQAALACAVADRLWRAQSIADQLEVALQSRDVIGQAKGVIMARTGCTAEVAFELLKAESQRRNIKLREIADHVALTGETPNPPIARER